MFVERRFSSAVRSLQVIVLNYYMQHWTAAHQKAEWREAAREQPCISGEAGLRRYSKGQSSQTWQSSVCLLLDTHYPYVCWLAGDLASLLACVYRQETFRLNIEIINTFPSAQDVSFFHGSKSNAGLARKLVA